MSTTKQPQESKARGFALSLIQCWPRSRGTVFNSSIWALFLIAARLLQHEQLQDFWLLSIFGLIAWGIVAFALAARFQYWPWVGWPIALAGFLALQYVIVTPPSVRQHDVEGHREYIEHLTTEGSLPNVQLGWETWQPPLYYIAAAAWRWLFSSVTFADAFRSVQFFASVLYLTAIVAALPTFRRLGFNDLESVAALGLLALLPGHVFFAGRINNDVLLPVLGAGLLFATAEFVKTKVPITDNSSTGKRWLWWVAILCPALLATKGSSLAIVGGVLTLVFCVESHRSNWRAALWPSCLTALPAVAWQVFWWTRTALQTGNPLYVNAALPDNLLIHAPMAQRLCSFDFAAFLGGGFYYDEPMRQSYPTALVTSLLFGEYGMRDLNFHWPGLLRWGCLGMLLLLATGALIMPRSELRPVWVTCLVLVVCQTLITVTYALKFPYACNQNMRFFAPAFVPFCGLFGLGVAQFWQRGGSWARGALVIILAACLLGLIDFYRCMLFDPKT